MKCCPYCGSVLPKEDVKCCRECGKRLPATMQIMTAFDMDYLKNPHVRDGYYNLASLIAEIGLAYGTYLWDPQYKGLDDYVWHCRQAENL